MALNGRPCWIIFILLLLLSCVVASNGASDTELLLKVKENLENNNGLSSWNTSSSPCSGNHANWKGVLCYEGKVWGLKLENMGLKGVIDVDSLKELPYLRTISFMNNNFDGEWPEINKLVGLKSIYLSNNKFSGEIPAQTFKGMQWLKKIYLSNNKFEGDIPSSLALLPRLMELRLDGNKFSGLIPQFKETKLKYITIANNDLQGEIPSILNKMPVSSFSGNEALCGAPLEACHSKKPSIVSICIVAVVVGVALIVIGAAIIFILHRRRKRQPTTSVENPPSSLNNKGVRDAGDESHRSSRSVSSSTHSRRGDHMKLTFIRDDREKFDLQELLRASAEILGSGCFSSSYKASLMNGPSIVVKRFKQMNNVGKEEFQEHMRRIGRLSHPNLHPLVAYYYRKEEKLLVTDFVQNGSLAVRLHGHQALGEPSLDWPIRLKIVKGIAKGLEYLYKDMPSLIAPHGNLKSSNVLLTQTFEPLLTDYGLVPVINQEMAQDIMVIYKSPEYLQHGRISKKTDLWCLGILILEILTGKFPANFLQQGKGSEVSLASWVHSIAPEEWTKEVFDKEMGATKNSEGEMVKLLKIALDCCEGDVDKRWDLKEAVEKIQEVKERDLDESFYTSYASEADMNSSR
ncbi:pollen receptor-like kinase 1 [Gastrolobium bilobum]|uniref:pollen receptor-like kinase 1 n=1 Tax=Gastrolobium bilobum TaxID=150636 RepID=UPI002AB305BE|nr:pollen receptor-like kinase 1 [Gastrolobium bilobum]